MNNTNLTSEDKKKKSYILEWMGDKQMQTGLLQAKI